MRGIVIAYITAATIIYRIDSTLHAFIAVATAYNKVINYSCSRSCLYNIGEGSTLSAVLVICIVSKTATDFTYSMGIRHYLYEGIIISFSFLCKE